jgi:hypothetical protein
MSTVDFLPFANGATSPNVIDQATYVAAQSTGLWGDIGFTAGIAYSDYLNKVWRQSSVMSAALAHAISNTLGVDVLDPGGPSAVTALTAQLLSTMAAAAVASAPPVSPQGRLTLTTNTPVLQADVTGATVVYYTACVGNYLPIWNGTQFVNYQFSSDLTLSLTGAASANTLVDVYGINHSGSAVLGFSPVWANSTPGTCSRGTGAGTTQLVRTGGLWTNANTITLLNGATTYSAIPAGQATYLGSLYLDGTAGQVSCLGAFGQNRKWGVWNTYNRKTTALLGGDATASWASVPAAWRQSNAAAGNAVFSFTGLPEESVGLTFGQNVVVQQVGATQFIGIGVNSTTTPSGLLASVVGGVSNAIGATITAAHRLPPSLGINKINMLEYGWGNIYGIFYGTNASMQLTASYMS